MQSTWPLGRTGTGHPQRPSLESDSSSGSSRHLQSAGESWTILLTLNTPLMLMEPTNLAGGGSICDGGTKVKSQEQLVPPGKVGAQASKAPVSILCLADSLPFPSHLPSRISPFLPVLTILSQSSSLGISCTFGCVLHAHL